MSRCTHDNFSDRIADTGYGDKNHSLQQQRTKGCIKRKQSFHQVAFLSLGATRARASVLLVSTWKLLYTACKDLANLDNFTLGHRELGPPGTFRAECKLSVSILGLSPKWSRLELPWLEVRGWKKARPQVSCLGDFYWLWCEAMLWCWGQDARKTTRLPPLLMELCDFSNIFLPVMLNLIFDVLIFPHT